MARVGRGIPFLHIKQHTRGTSNEISLDVLEAKSNAADENKDAAAVGAGAPKRGGVFRKKAAKTPEAPLAQTDPAAEISRRKTRRRRARALNIAAVAVVAAALCLVGASYLSNRMNAQQGQKATLNEALDLIEQSDATVVSMDEALNSPLDGQSLADMKQLSSELSSTESLLDRAMNKAQEAMNGTEGTREQEIAQRAAEDIEARKVLVSQGKVLMASDISARQAADYLEEAWAEVLVGDALASDATRLVSSGVEANVQLGRDKENQSLEQFQQALVEVGYAKKAYPAIDVQVLIDYLNKRISAQEYAVASDEAILLQDRGTAEANNASANTASREAAALAANLPTNPTQPVLDAYSAADSQVRASYAQARTKAAEEDSFLRDYLGTTNK